MSPIKLSSKLTGKQVQNKLDRAFSPFTTIVIDKGNVIIDPTTPRCPQGGAVLWDIYNNDSDPHKVEIDPSSFTPANPLLGGKQSVFVESKQLKYLVAAIKPDAPIQLYKYTIKSDDNSLDPDLDVVDP
jgi:hypothetical protein